MRLALAQVGDMMYELIEPVDAPNSYQGFLDTRGERHGPRLRPAGYTTSASSSKTSTRPSLPWSAKASACCKAAGRSASTVTGYANFETDGALGCIVEAIEMPKTMPDPERTYPA